MQNYKRVKLACYSTNISMAVVSNLSPLLFLTFRNLYGLSYSLLGALVLVNFVTQLIVDLSFSFFSHKFNIPLSIKITPLLSVLGLLLFACAPILFPSNVYLGLVVGTLIFSASSGFAEVLISPVIDAIPSDNPEREMSLLHSIYAWGVVFVIIVGTLFLLIFKGENWQWLAVLMSIIPLIAFILFTNAQLPALSTPERVSGVLTMLKNKRLWLCVTAIFLGGAAECTMAQWSSSFIEQVLGIPKVFGDIFGVALFGLALGVGRTLYSKFGKNISLALILGSIGSALCYLTASLSNIPVLGLIACALTGFCVSMLWPGSLIVASDSFPKAGVFIFAMMAAGGDLGASVGPQLVGIVADVVSSSSFGERLGSILNVSAEQAGMKLGIAIGIVFSVLAVVVFARLFKRKKEN